MQWLRGSHNKSISTPAHASCVHQLSNRLACASQCFRSPWQQHTLILFSQNGFPSRHSNFTLLCYLLCILSSLTVKKVYVPVMLSHPHITTTHHTYNPHGPHTETGRWDFTSWAVITGITQHWHKLPAHLMWHGSDGSLHTLMHRQTVGLTLQPPTLLLCKPRRGLSRPGLTSPSH